MYNLHPPDTKFEVGKAITLRDGKDVAFIATGETVVHCLLAAGNFWPNAD
jgi:transketolase